MPGLKLGKEAQAKFNEAKVSPDKQGALEKKGAKRKNWNDRWFVLKDNYLFYCKNEKSNPQGIINLHGCTVSPIQGPTARASSFSLLAPKSVSIDAKWTNRTYFMAAKDSKEMESWMTKLEDAGKKAVERAAAKKAESGVKEEPKPTPTEPPKEVREAKSTSDSDDFSSEDEKPKAEIKKEEPKKEEPKPVEVKKVEPAPKEEPKETPSSPKKKKSSRSKDGEKKEKKEKKHKKDKKVKKSSSKEAKPKDSDDEPAPPKKEEPKVVPKKADSSDSEEEEKKPEPVKKVESPRKKDDSDSASESEEEKKPAPKKDDSDSDSD